MLIKKGWIFVLILLAIPLSFGLTINPQQYEITDFGYNKTYQIVATIINTDSQEYDLNIFLDKSSGYLADQVSFEPKHVKLAPMQSENLRITANFKESLSPERHTIRLNLVSASLILGKFDIIFTAPGKPENDLQLLGFSATDVLSEEPVVFSISLDNKGNTIAKGMHHIEIMQDGKVVEESKGEQELQILPKSDYNVSVIYDPTALQPGRYAARARFAYNGLETQTLEDDFEIFDSSDAAKLAEEEKNIKKGDRVMLNLTLENPSGQLSFYRIAYGISGSYVNGIEEGQITTTSKDISLDIDTSGLPVGEHLLELDIASGKQLEDLEKKRILIIVRSDSNIYLQLGLLAFAGGLLTYYVVKPAILEKYLSRKRDKKKDAITAKKAAAGSTTSGTAASQIPVPPPARPVRLIDQGHGGFAGSESLFAEISHAKADLGRLDMQIAGFTKDLNSFIMSSNDWLEKNTGGGHGFR